MIPFNKLKIFYIVIISVFMNFCNTSHKDEMNSAQKNNIIKKDSINNEVIDYVENYLINSTRFSTIEDEVGNPLTKNNIKEWYHIFHIENQNFDSVDISIFQIGVNSSHSKEDLLIQKIYKTKKIDYKIIDDSVSLNNTIKLYNFFEQYSKFSSNTKVICYEKIIIDAAQR